MFFNRNNNNDTLPSLLETTGEILVCFYVLFAFRSSGYFTFPPSAFPCRPRDEIREKPRGQGKTRFCFLYLKQIIIDVIAYLDG